MNAKNILTLVAVLATSAHAQVIRVVPEAFPVAPAQTTLPIKPLEAAKAPAVDLRLVIKTGDLISVRIVEWARKNGYAVTWEAPEYRSQADLTLSGDFDISLNQFLGSMRLNQARLEAEIYTNNAVRIMEVK